MKEETRCESCGKETQPFTSILFGSMEKGYRNLCLACYNASFAEDMGLNFDHVDFAPIKLTDVAGEEHEFHFAARLLGDKVSLEALEIKDGIPRGYHFQVIGSNPEGEPLVLFKELYERMRRALSQKHLDNDDDYGPHISNEGIARGRIDIDLDDSEGDRKPLMVIDGKEISWQEFGRMLLEYEGWNFKIEIFDRSEER